MTQRKRHMANAYCNGGTDLVWNEKVTKVFLEKVILSKDYKVAR